MSDLHVVVGAGPVGRATAVQLAAEGHEVVLASRSGAGPDLSGVRRAAADAADADRLAELATGAVALYNCVNPPTTTSGRPSGRRWPRRSWRPPSAAARCWSPPRASTATALSTSRWSRACPTPRPGQGADPGRDVGRGPRRPRGRPDPRGRGARLRLHGSVDHQCAHPAGDLAGARRQDRAGVRASRPAALVHRRARHGPGAGGRCPGAADVGPGLARADQRPGDPGSGRRRRVPRRRSWSRSP